MPWIETEPHLKCTPWTKKPNLLEERTGLLARHPRYRRLEWLGWYPMSAAADLPAAEDFWKRRFHFSNSVSSLVGGIETHLTSQMSHSRFGPALRDYLQDQFLSRREIYVASVHKAAYFLHPLNSGKTLNPIDRAEVLTFLRGSTPESQQSLVEKSFDRFRARELEFDRPDL